MQDFVRLLQGIFGPALDQCGSRQWAPAVDIYRTPTGWAVKADLAGVEAVDVQWRVDGQRLLIWGTRRDSLVQRNCQVYRMEITYSSFQREVTVPCDLEHAAIRVEESHGMLIWWIDCSRASEA
jgi:HSP20 family protein